MEINQSQKFFLQGMENLSDPETALEYFQKAESLGNLAALEKIILIAHYNHFWDEYKTAVDKLFEVAATGEFCTAQIIFNLMSEEDFEVEDAAKGAKTLLHFGKQGHIDSIIFAHELLEIEKFPPAYSNEIFNLLFVQAKKINSADLIFKVGECFFFGCGVDKDIDAANFWFQKLKNFKTENIFERLNINIAKTYLSGNFDIEKINRLKSYRRRAQNGDEDAIKIISEIYCDGNGIAPNGNEAVEWLKLLYNNENFEMLYRLDALRSIAEIYRYGHGGVAVDDEKAIYYFELMLNLGGGRNATAERNILEIYLNGADKNKAVERLRRSADSGFILAKKKLADLYAVGKFVEKNEAAAISLYKEILDCEDPRTQIEIMQKIAYLYKNIDKKISDEWYKIANDKSKILNYSFNRLTDNLHLSRSVPNE